MIADKLYLKNFRNCCEESFNFEDNVNIFIGENGQGKTNILEALYYFASQKSFRSAKGRELIRWGQDFFEITLDFTRGEREIHALSRIKAAGGRENYLNGVKKRRSADMVGEFNCVIFAPEHMGLIKEGPSARRSIIDFALCQTDGDYFVSLSRFKKTLEQKNAYLKRAKGFADENMISVYNEQLSKEICGIMKKRARFIESLSKRAGLRQSDISGGRESLRLIYRPNIDAWEQSEIFSSLQKNAPEEIRAGVSIAGTHRDDMDILINEREAKTFASQGQQRSAVLSIKLSEGELFKEKTGEYPVLLLDDILSELDRFRQSYIVSAVNDMQIFLTCCDEESIEKIRGGRRFYIKNGSVFNII